MKLAAAALLSAVETVLLLTTASSARQIAQATDAAKPLSPVESRERFRVPEGFRVELVAAEPELMEPTALCFDARGRIFVSELHGYNRDGYYDILELNKSGVLDQAVRRIPATKEAQRRGNEETYGTVRLLETDASGRVIRSTVFADHLPAAYGVIPAPDGVIVLCAPDIVLLRDRDGDGKAEIRETLFTGFGVGEIWSRISNPRPGLDNWIYAAAGQSSGGTIQGPHLKAPVQLGSTCFRFKLDGSQFEPVTGGTSGFGLALDDWCDRFLCTNQQHALYVAPLPYHSLARNPYFAAVNPIINISTYGHPARVFPTSKPDPWRLKRGQQSEWEKFYGTAETNAGQMTSACAPTIYQADQFPAAYRGNLFSCEPAQNLIHRCLIEPKGAGFEVKRGEQGREFLTSSDQWFRPVNLAVGPEGALYVVDMYREIIEDYSAIPRYLQQQYLESLRNGQKHGRIWRIAYGEPTPAANANLAAASNDQLVAELAGSNAWRRLTAQGLLVIRGDREVAPALEQVARAGKTPQARLHALYTLDGLVSLNPELVKHALDDDHYAVRVQALRLAERWLEREPNLLSKVLTKVDDPHPKVRLQLAFTLGESTSPKVVPALARLVETDGQDPWMQTAVQSAVPARSAALAMLLAKRGNQRGNQLLRPLAAVAGTRRDADEIAGLLQWLADLHSQKSAPVRESVMTGLIEGLARDSSRKTLSAPAQKALERLLSASTGSDRGQVLRLAGLLRLDDSPIVRALRRAAVGSALDEQLPLAGRSDALASLSDAPAKELAPLRKLLDVRQPIDLQLAAASLLAAGDGPDSIASLFKGWSSYSPRVQTAILDAVCARKDRLALVLDAIEQKVIKSSSISPLRREQLLNDRDPAIQERAKSLFSPRQTSEDRERVVAQYQAALSQPRDADRGRQVFETQCSKCHQLNGKGFALAPDLAAINNRPDESLLLDILDPNSTIVAGYQAFRVDTVDGRVYSGVLASETATSITLRREQGAEDTILRKDIDAMVGSSLSLMPEGIDNLVSPQDMANLIGYLRSALRDDQRLPTRSLDLPPRHPSALPGSAFALSIADLPLDKREEKVLAQVKAGNVPSFLRKLVPVAVSAGTFKASYWVAPDYLAIGSDDDFFLTPLSPLTAQAIADSLDCVLPTPKMVDDIYASATLKLRPAPIPPSPAMTRVPVFLRHNETVSAARGKRPPGALVAGHKKDVVIAGKVFTTRGRVAIYGWHKPDGKPIQPLYVGHAASHVDYSHGIRLVSRRMMVNGVAKTIEEVLADPETAPLLSNEGPMLQTRYRRTNSSPLLKTVPRASSK
jgi:putative membrane-bound dehydrogenase-like protein